jgi:ribosomal protein S18 acetylase RimI-like enzyme
MLPDHITVRLAISADAGEIADMSRELIETGLSWSWTRSRVARAIADADTVALIACDAERLVGFALMYFGDEHAHLTLLAVRPQYQRAGIGRHLVAWLVESGLVAGVAAIRLELRASNRVGRRFYERLGFAVTGRVLGYYGGVESALRMTRDIRRGRRGPVAEWRHLLRGRTGGGTHG